MEVSEARTPKTVAVASTSKPIRPKTAWQRRHLLRLSGPRGNLLGRVLLRRAEPI